MNLNYINNLSTVLFDYDGLLVDTEKLYFEAWAQLLNEEGKKICFKIYAGNHESETYKVVKDYLLEPLTLEELSKAKANKYNELIQSGSLELMPGIEKLLKNISKLKNLSIVSNSTKEVVQEGILHTKIDSYFKDLFCVNPSIPRKPAPDLYLYVLDELQIKSSSVITFEDSITGIVSAQKAGIEVICINKKEEMKEYCFENNISWYESAEMVEL